MSHRVRGNHSRDGDICLILSTCRSCCTQSTVLDTDRVRLRLRLKPAMLLATRSIPTAQLYSGEYKPAGETHHPQRSFSRAED